MISILKSVYPENCVACGKERYIENIPLCRKCSSKIIMNSGSICRKCGRRSEKLLCGECSDSAFDYARSVCFYSDVSSALIKSFKYGNASQSGVLMATMLSQYIASDPVLNGCDALTFIPFGYFKRFNRFYNHSEKLCYMVSELTGMDVEENLLRQNNIVPQAVLPAFLRRRRGALFRSSGYTPKSEKILIIDDVMTTGRTLSDAAKILKKNNKSQSVCCLTFAC